MKISTGFFAGIAQNAVLHAAIGAWFTAQVLKFFIDRILSKRWSLERIVGSGGMPSSHAAMVCALTTSVILHYTTASPLFAICVVQTAVVLYDARGVRLETGKQARVLTAIMDSLKERGGACDVPEVNLKEFIGHTPIQVLVGALLGVAVALIIG